MNSKCFCGKGKWDWQLFCKACWFNLPAAMRRQLYAAGRNGEPVRGLMLEARKLLAKVSL